MTAQIEQAVGRIRAWGEARDWAGWDPYDGLNAPAAPVLTLGTRTGRRVLTQFVKLSPVNPRPLLGIRRAHNHKAIGLVASAYARLAAAGDPSARTAADRWLDWLTANTARTDTGKAWGYHFPVQTRVFRYERGAPNIIATSFVAQAFLDACELLGPQERWTAAVRETVAYLLAWLRPGVHFTYLEGEDELVHNANLMGCAVIARAARVLGEDVHLEAVREALAVSLDAQRPDGSWPYADRAGHDWVDNFHTAYVLDSLAECARSFPEAGAPLARGVDYWHREMFLPDGTPRYYAGRTYPLDGHCYATAIDTWVALAGRDERAPAEAQRIASRLIEDWIAPDGHVRFQRRPRWRSDVAYVRWTTAPTFKALAGMLHARLD